MTDTEAIASRFAKAWSEHCQIDCTDAVHTADDAYRIQDAVYAARFPGERPRAWKAGTSGPGAEITAAPIGSVLRSPAAISANSFHMFGIEGEVAFRMREDLPGKARDWTPDQCARAVDELLVTIEICDTRLADWKSAAALTKLADFQLNGALAVGSGTPSWRTIDFGTQRAELWVNGTLKLARVGTHPLGNPLALLPWAAGHCDRRFGGLRAGDLVTTGSWTGMVFAKPGDMIEARFPGIGEASVRIG